MAASLFSHSDYRSAVEAAIERVRFHKTVTFARLAKLCGIQATYFSNVLKGRADFSPDQLYSLGHALEVSDGELDFLMLLLDWERSGHKERKRALARRIERIREENLSTARHLAAKKVPVEEGGAAEYYLDPMTKVVHVHLGVEKYARDPKLIAEVLSLSPEYLGRLLETLLRLGFIEPKGGGYTVKLKHRHLPDESPLCLPHQILMRTRSLDRVQRLPKGRRYGLSATFSTTPEIRARIQAEFLDFVKRAEGLANSGRETHVYQMNFDLFPWGD